MSYINLDLFNKLLHQYLIIETYFGCIAFEHLNLSFATHKMLSYEHIRIIVFLLGKVLLNWQAFSLGKHEITW